MKNLLVMGDSFCHYRSIYTDWPVHLSTLLGLNLIGEGILGGSWWFIRKSFMEIYTSNEFKETDLIVYCHTEPLRIIGTDRTLGINGDDPDIVKPYLLKLQNIEFNHWCCRQWFSELNNLLADKKVIHIQNFELTTDYFNILDGVKVVTPTWHQLSLTELGGNNNKFLWDSRRNHFCEENNLKIANKLYGIYNAVDNWKNESWELTL